MLQGAMSQEKYFTDIRINLICIRKMSKKGSQPFIALLCFIPSPSVQGFPAFSPQQLSEAGIISPFKVGKLRLRRG